MTEFIVNFIGPTSCLRSVLMTADSAEQAKLKALSTSTPWLCAEYFEGRIQLDVAYAPRRGESA